MLTACLAVSNKLSGSSVPLQVLTVLKAAPQLSNVLRAVESDLMELREGQQPTSSGYMDVLPWLLNQAQDFEAAANASAAKRSMQASPVRPITAQGPDCMSRMHGLSVDWQQRFELPSGPGGGCFADQACRGISAALTADASWRLHSASSGCLLISDRCGLHRAASYQFRSSGPLCTDRLIRFCRLNQQSLQL